MIKKTIITFIALIILNTVIVYNSGVNSTADECNDCTPIPSTPGETDYCSISQNDPESKPVIQASSEEIGPGDSITLHINSGSLAHPPYNWSVSNAKYTLDKSTSVSNLEIVTLTAALGTCSGGYTSDNVHVTVTVTDQCGITSQAYVRNTVGNWAVFAGARKVNDLGHNCDPTSFPAYTIWYYEGANKSWGVVYHYCYRYLSDPAWWNYLEDPDWEDPPCGDVEGCERPGCSGGCHAYPVSAYIRYWGCW